MTKRNPAASDITLAERLASGWFSVDEACSLRNCSRSIIYEDIREGRLAIEKHGRRTKIYGPELQRYLAAGRGA
jgi:excisionase family DNA binding protein